MTDFDSTAAAAVQFVQEGQDTFLGKADTYLEKTQQYVQNLSHFWTTPTTFSVDFNFAGQLTPFQRPQAPVLSDVDYDLGTVEQPGPPAAFDAQTPDLDPLPVFNTPAPTMAFGPKPDDPNVAMPTPPPRPVMPTVPAEPDFASLAPEPVTLLSLNLPQLPSITLPTFKSQRPSLPPFNFNENFSFTPQEYVSAFLEKIKSRLSTWADGQEALPAAIERALFNRGRDRVAEEVQAQIEQAYDDFGARGFTAPSGMLTARVDAIRKDGQDKVAEFNRDAMLKSFDEALANMRLAVQAGIQLEGLTINLHLEQERLLLQSASFARDTGIALLNARIAQFNAEMQGYQIDAQVLEIQIKAELAKLDMYRAQIEAEQLKGEINKDTVALYEAQWGAVKTMADAYATRVEAVKAEVDVRLAPIESFKAETQAYAALLDAQAKRWDGYRTSVEAESAKAGVYQQAVQAYATRTQAVVQYGGLKMDRERLRLAEHQQSLQQYAADLQRLDYLLRSKDARLGAIATRDTNKVSLFRGRADVEQAASAAADRTFELGLSKAQAEANAQLETARIRSSENVALQGLMLEALKAIASVQSQLAASTMSALHYSAGVSASDSFSHSRSVGWSGEATDWNSSLV